MRRLGTTWMRLVALLLVLGAALATNTIGSGKRGKLSLQYKGRKDFKPITGTYPSVEAKEYYQNPKVRPGRHSQIRLMQLTLKAKYYI